MFKFSLKWGSMILILCLIATFSACNSSYGISQIVDKANAEEATQKMADQSYNAKKAMEYLNKGRDMENCKKAYEYALKADEKTKASVIKILRAWDFPFP